jgi:hypothetical protein
MDPLAKRVAILITELMVFFIVTAVMVYFVSYAGALEYSEKDVPPAHFPVIAYDGNREQPDAKNYIVVPWGEWEALVAKRPGASLLLPQRSGNILVGTDSKAIFKSVPDGESRQSVELTWTGNAGEQQVRYTAQARTLTPHYYRAVTTTTLLLGAATGFIAGLFTGRKMRRRWLAQPGYYAPSTPNRQD